jgi:predicted O-methyltransferase YrrM
LGAAVEMISVQIPFDIDCGTLSGKSLAAAWVSELYTRYSMELSVLTRELAPLRDGMIASGYGADLGDMESEILYMLLRETRPEIVVEISPCHGYSTNYILAALTKTGIGSLHSYEITKETNGRPTEQIIAANLLPSLDRARLNIHIGDAVVAKIPDADFLFIDSAHESWFAAWYVKKLVPRAKLCFVHDIIVQDRATGTLIPKAPTTGIRESFFLLHALFVAQMPLAAIADIELHLKPAARSTIAPRHGYPERSVVFEGKKFNDDVFRICNAQLEILDLRQKILLGDRWAGIFGARKIACENPDDPFTRLCAYQLAADLGYRSWSVDRNFSDMMLDLDCIPRGRLSDIATFVAALELGLRLDYAPLIRNTLAHHRDLRSNATGFFVPIYKAHAYPFNRLAASLWRRFA